MYQSSSDGMRKMDKMVLCLLFLCVNLSAFNAANPGYEDTDDDNGGHSTEFRPMGYEWNIAELEYGHDMLNKIYWLSKKRSAFPIGIRAIGKKGEKVEFDAEFYKFYKALPEVLKTLQARLESVLNDNGIIGVVTGRIKSLSSLSTKMEKDGITDYRKITDIVGARVTFQTIDDILKFKKAYVEAFNNTVNEIRCYGICGPAVGSVDQREKVYWPWKSSGYRRLHFKVALPEVDTAGEVQMGTPYMTLWADWGHDVVYKGPARFTENENVKKYAQRLAKYYMMLDDIRNDMLPSCPQILEESLKESDSSLNECLFWNDLRTNM